jgi:hypothetical protein
MADRIYVNVNMNMDRVGYMTPKIIEWEDGRKFPIDEVVDLRSVDPFQTPSRLDRYTVKVKGETRYLYFEKGGNGLPNITGRWFVEARE